MRDLHDHARDMMLDLTGERLDVPQIGEIPRVDPAADMPAWLDVGDGVDDPVPFGPADVADGGPARQTHAGSGEGRNAAHGAAMGLPAHVVMAADAADAVMLAAASHFAALLDWSVAYVAAAGPLPLASAEPWAMFDGEYWAYLIKRVPHILRANWREINEGATLDEIGADNGIPRPRLVTMPQRTEETRP